MTLQVANLTNKKIIVHTNQPLAKMTRLNEIQINRIQQGKQQLVTDNVPAIPNIGRKETNDKKARKRFSS